MTMPPGSIAILALWMAGYAPVGTARSPSRTCAMTVDTCSTRRRGGHQRSAAWNIAALIAVAVLMPAAAMAQAGGDSGTELELGRRIYSEGILSSGAKLTGDRRGGGSVSGAVAACTQCHRRSGMGQVEASILVPPITGNFLFATRSDKRVATMDPHVSKHFNQAHDPYTEVALAAAIRDGTDVNGRAMNYLMPRYDLSERDLKALTTYLRQLSAQWSPGVSQTHIRFATVITPDVDSARRKVFVDMMRSSFRQKNASTVPAGQSRTRHHMTSAAELILGTERKWDLDIWELQGPPEGWHEQLTEHYRRRPVFALLSGLSSSTWQPIHDFCEAEHVPGWFPSVDVPGQHQSAYSFYFSGAVRLEAAVLARHLSDQKALPKRVVQIYRDDATGRSSAKALAKALVTSRIAVTDRILVSNLPATEALRQALGTVGTEDAVMFWLRPEDIAALGDIQPTAASNYFSGVLGKGEHAPLPAAWRARSSLVYLQELPENRKKNLEYLHAWLNIQKLALVDEAMQSEVFFAVNFMTDTIAEMLDNLYRDYLLDRAETMLSVREGTKSAQETRDRVALGLEGDLLRRYGAKTMDERARIQIASQGTSAGTSEGTTPYPHLSLGPDQRFASKGGYIVRLAGGNGLRLLAESGLIIP
jgi:hypothetical protein